jgi:hypothetical protein
VVAGSRLITGHPKNARQAIDVEEEKDLRKGHQTGGPIDTLDAIAEEANEGSDDSVDNEESKASAVYSASSRSHSIMS